MRGYQRCIFAGNLGDDPVIRQTAGGTTVANLSIAVNERYKDKETTYWVRAVAFGKVAEIFGDHLSKGDALLVEGRLQLNKWEDREGNERQTTELIVDNFAFLGQAGNGGRRQEERSEDEGVPEQGDLDDDIPF